MAHSYRFLPGKITFIATLFFASLVFIAIFDNMLPLLCGICIFILLIFFGFINPQAMLIMTVFASILIPMDFSIKTHWLFRIGPTRMILAALIIGWMLRCLRSRHPSLSRQHLPLLGYVVLYVFSGIFSSFFSIAPLVSFYAVLGRDILEQFLLFYFIGFYLNQPAFWPKLKTAIFFGTALVCFYAFYEFIAQRNPILPIFEGANVEFREGVLRVRSNFFHPIALGCYLNLIVPFVLAEWIQNRKRRKVLTLLILVMLVASFLTVSRVPWICLIIEAFIFLAWWGVRSIRNATLVMAVTGLCFAATFYTYNNIKSLQRLFMPIVSPQRQDEISSEFYRIALVEAIVEHIHGSRLIYGYGPNTFQLAGVRSSYEGERAVFTSPDNHYARLLLEYGIIGLVFFIILLIFALHKSIISIRRARDETEKLLSVACLASMTGFIVLNLSASMFQMYPLGMLFWMCVAIAIGSTKHSESPLPDFN